MIEDKERNEVDKSKLKVRAISVHKNWKYEISKIKLLNVPITKKEPPIRQPYFIRPVTSGPLGVYKLLNIRSVSLCPVDVSAVPRCVNDICLTTAPLTTPYSDRQVLLFLLALINPQNVSHLSTDPSLSENCAPGLTRTVVSVEITRTVLLRPIRKTVVPETMPISVISFYQFIYCNFRNLLCYTKLPK